MEKEYTKGVVCRYESPQRGSCFYLRYVEERIVCHNGAYGFAGTGTT